MIAAAIPSELVGLFLSFGVFCFGAGWTAACLVLVAARAFREWKRERDWSLFERRHDQRGGTPRC